MRNKLLQMAHQIPPVRRLLTEYALRRQYLRASGWGRSVSCGLPVDEFGSPLPWFTYSSLGFLESRLSADFSVFEYGSGHSTLWFAARTASVVSVEHDPDFFRQMEVRFRQWPGIQYLYRTLESGSYCDEILRYDGAFDMVVIDGRERNICARHAVKALKPSGVIIWDNSDRSEYSEGFDYLVAQGFRRIDFWGMGPINAYMWCTSVFYRDGNCLGI